MNKPKTELTMDNVTRQRYTEIERKHICVAFRYYTEEQDVMDYLNRVGVRARPYDSFYQQYNYLGRTGNIIFWSDLTDIKDVPIPADLQDDATPPSLSTFPPTLDDLSPDSPPACPWLSSEMDFEFVGEQDSLGLYTQQPTCGICFDRCHYVAATRCGHVFCTQCIISHICADEEQTQECPTCRAPLSGLGTVHCLPYNSTEQDVFNHYNSKQE